MNRKATIKDIARETGVSDTTVSLCFKENSRISEATRNRVLEVAAKLQYIPSHAARNLRFGINNLIGIVVTDVTNPFHARMIQIADRIANRNNYRIIFAQSHWDAKVEVSCIRDLISHGVRGLVIFFNEKTRESYDLIMKSNIPYIAVDTLPSFYNGAYVVNDLFNSGVLAAEHLIDKGCRRFAFIGDKTDDHVFSNAASFSLAEGFVKTLTENAVKRQDIVTIQAGLTLEEGKKAFHKLLSTYGEYDGIFCVNDMCAIGAMEAARIMGYEIGKAIKLVGIDNLDISSLSCISLTSIEEPREKIMEIALSKLIESFESGREPLVRESLASKLIIRKSSIGNL